MALKKIRNVAVIAHVDHGKTSLMDQLIRESGSLQKGEQGAERLMDSNDLEKERGITILSKCTTLHWDDHQLNVVDTPGHADFGGEVERILDMVDGVLLVVDAAESVMPQTKFVVTKALEQGLRPIVVINKMDKPDERADVVEEEVMDLFFALNATEEQLDFPIIYASAKAGWAVKERDDEKKNMRPLLEAIVQHVPPPEGDGEAPLQLLVTTIASAPFLGRILTGRIHAGTLRENMAIHALDSDGKVVDRGRITKIFHTQTSEKKFITEASAGEIVSIAGLTKATVAHTIATPDCLQPLKSIPIDPPTLTMRFTINDSPLAGRDGSKLTPSMLRDRLMNEMEHNVSIQVSESGGGQGFEVAGRGELQLGILIETMRREGFELSISRPKVLFKKDAQGKRLEPIEEVQIDVEEPYLGTVMDALNKRFAQVHNMLPIDGNRMRIQFNAPTRALIGFHSQLLTDTRGTATMNRNFKGYEPYRGDLATLRNGVLVSLGKGKTLAYSLMNIEARGILFIGPGEEVYEGMIIGEHSRNNDLSVNPLKGKKLTNMRASGSDKEVKLTTPRMMNLEECLCYLQEGEWLEVTPSKLRLRKK